MVRPARLCALVLALLTLAGCGLLGDSDDSGGAPPQGNLEKSKIKIAILPTTDIIPLYLAIDNGYFKQEGLEIETVMGRSGGDNVNKLTSGDVDVAFASYTPFFVAKAKKVADVKLVTDATSAGPKSYPVIATPNSPVKTIRDMEGRRVGITAKLTMSHLMPMSVLKINGINIEKIQWVEMPFGAMAERLKNGEIDAAYIAEPHLQRASRSVSAFQVFDTAVGPTADIPLTGYGATADFVNKNPNTLKAYQRVMVRATEESRTSRATVDSMVTKHLDVDENTAKLMVETRFQSSLDPQRLERVVDLMLEFGALTEKINVREMIVAPPAPTANNAR